MMMSLDCPHAVVFHRFAADAHGPLSVLSPDDQSPFFDIRQNQDALGLGDDLFAILNQFVKPIHGCIGADIYFLGRFAKRWSHK